MVESQATAWEHPSVARYLLEASRVPNAASDAHGVENRIIRGDALDVLASLPNDSVDLVHTSPPYNISRPYELSPSDKGPLAEYVDFLKSAIGQLKRVVRPGGSIFWQTGYTKDAGHASGIVPIDTLSYNIFHSAPNSFVLWDRVIWRYWGGHAFTKKFTNKHETIMWYVKPGAEPTFDVDRVREQSKEYDKRNNFWGRNPGNVWEVDRVAYGSTDQTSHIAVFPEELTERIVRACSEPNSLVLDPFSGSGTVPKVAHGLGRRWLGIEISPVYAAEASVRVGFQQPSESHSLASELIKHVAFEGDTGTLRLREVHDRLKMWALQLPLSRLRSDFESDMALVFQDGNGRNLVKRDIWVKYDDLLGERHESGNPVVLADRLLSNCYKLRQRFNGVSRYKSALLAIEAVAENMTRPSAMRYVAQIAEHEPSSFAANGDDLELHSARREISVTASGTPLTPSKLEQQSWAYQGRMQL